MTIAATTGSLIFNFTTNGNNELMRERFEGIIADPALLGIMLATVYAIAGTSQVIVGMLLDRFPMKPLYVGIVLSQIIPLFFAASTI